LSGIGEIKVKGMIITGGGEPCLFKDLGLFVKKVSNTGIDVTLTTNGQLIHRHFTELMHHLKRIRFSIDAASPDTFKVTHGMKEKDFHQVIENLQAAVCYKRQEKLPIDIGVSYLLCDANLKEIDTAVEFYRNKGIDFLHFKPMQFMDTASKRYYYKTYTGMGKLASKISSIAEDGFRVTLSRENYYRTSRPNIVYDRCHGAFFDLIIGADGKAYTCCHFKYDPKFCYGDLHRDTLVDLLKKVNAPVSEKCFAHCKMDALNQFVEYAIHHPEEVLPRCKDVKTEKLPLGSKWL